MRGEERERKGPLFRATSSLFAFEKAKLRPENLNYEIATFCLLYHWLSSPICAKVPLLLLQKEQAPERLHSRQGRLKGPVAKIGDFFFAWNGSLPLIKL